MNKKLNFKWNKDNFSIEVTKEKTVEELKSTIQTLKSVESDRQKLLLKGKVLDNNVNLDTIPDNAVITLMGTASANSNITTSQVKFVEDLSPEEKAKLLREKGHELSFGLQNLGNTCYFNSTIQVLGRVPELRNSLKELGTSSQGPNDISKQFAKEFGNTYDQLDKASTTVVPFKLVTLLRALNPLFAEQEKGYYKQQDAEECWTFVLNSIRDHLKSNTQEKFSNYLVDELFGIQQEIKLSNVEDTTDIKQKKEIIYKLPCYIDSTTVELSAGLKAGLKENIELFSDTLQRNSFYEKSWLISRLPPYLTIQFMRFFWKKENINTGSKAGKAKILKSIIYSRYLDLYDMCNKQTQELLDVGRAIEVKMNKNELDKMDVDKDGKETAQKQEQAQDSASMIPTGKFQLISVLTHQGRSSESGHYIGWAHQKGDLWVKYDDDVISYVKTQDILDLKGGGDWHMNYICIFKRLEVPFMEV
jgi:ubiquitin carboxyl-terminal hydrolase 14